MTAWPRPHGLLRTVRRREQTPSRLIAALWVAAVMGGLLVRVPIVAEPLGIDQGIFATIGWGLHEGLRPYGDLWDQKPPGIHLTYLAAFLVWGPTTKAVAALDIFTTALTGLFLFLVGRRCGGSARGLRAAALYVVLTIPAGQYKYGGFLERAVPEVFMCTLMAAAAFRAADAQGRPGWASWAWGALLGAALVFKPVAVFYWPALLLFTKLVNPDHRLFKTAGLSMLGLLAVPAIVGAWLWSQNAGEDARVAIFGYNASYLAFELRWDAFAIAFLKEGWLRVKTDALWLLGGVAICVAAWDWIRRREVDVGSALGALWLAGALAGAFASGARLFTTYFIPSLPPLALLAAGLFASASRRRVAVQASAAILAAAVIAHYGYTRRVYLVTAANLQQLTRDGDRQEAYLERFGGYANGRGYSARANAELAAYLRAHTSPADRVFIFGMQPGVYFASLRLPANRFVWIAPAVSGMFVHPDFTLATLAASLRQTPPAYFILERNDRNADEHFASPPIQDLLGRYSHETDIEDFVLYRRVPS
ncbi:MAG: hypothetical protein HYX76_10410 [Acidobacteria bacterium]|nr:hypothetical protein [Acidobacteriota bacterium]